MTRQETGFIMDLLTTAYPHFYNGPYAPDRMRVLSLWSSMFADDDPRIVGAAIRDLIATKTGGYPPSIGDVKEKIRQIKYPEEMTALEAWSRVSKALRNSLYNSKEEYERLPESVRRVVGGPEQLREWSMMDSETVESVVSSHFQRDYRVHLEREHEQAKLPESIKTITAQIAGGMKMSALPRGVGDDG